jgi:hypothetical protein
MSRSAVSMYVIAIFIILFPTRVISQNTFPEVLKKGSIPEQLRYLDEHTKIYENYRAIREDMFRTVNKNILDTLHLSNKTINSLAAQKGILKSRIDSLQKSLETVQTDLDTKTRTKNSIGVLGMQVNKTAYNGFMWSVVAILAFLLITGYLTFRHNRTVTLKTRNELGQLKDEFEDYRKKTRIEREKTAVEHFNEIKKLKSGPGKM